MFYRSTSRLEGETNELLNSQLKKTKMNVEPSNHATNIQPRSMSRTSSMKINDLKDDVRKSFDDR